MAKSIIKHLDLEIRCLQSEIQSLTQHNVPVCGLATENTEEVPYEWKCPISGKLMRIPVKAYDNVVYDKQNIKNWVLYNDLTSPITGQKMGSYSVSYQSDLQRKIFAYMEKHPQLFEYESFWDDFVSLFRDLYNWICIKLGVRPKPPPKLLSTELARLRTIKTFHCITNNKFSDKEINMEQLCNPTLIKENLPESWWPISDKQEMGKAVWGSCKSLRDRVYVEFFDIVSKENFKTYAETYFPPSLSSNFTSYYRYILLQAMENCVKNLLPSDIPYRKEIEKRIKDSRDYKTGLLRWRNFWNESPEDWGRYN
jgi:hypothetical protein